MGKRAGTYHLEFGDRQGTLRAFQLDSILPALKPHCITLPGVIRKSSRLTGHCADARIAVKSNDQHRPGTLPDQNVEK